MNLVKGLLAWTASAGSGAQWDGSRCAGSEGVCASDCVSACPAQALAWRDDALQPADTCDACGLCAPACPMGALAVGSVSRTLEEARRRRAATYWFCERVPPALRGSGGACVPCLGALPSEALVDCAALFSSPVFLQAGPCGECPRGPAYSSRAQSRLRGLAQYLERVAQKPVLVFGAPSAETQESRPGLSRRAFFSALRGSAAVLIPEPEGAPENACIHGPDLSRGTLLMALRRLSGDRPLPEGGAGALRALSLPAVAKEACTLCGRCALACRPGALAVRISGGTLALELEADRCTGCAACAETCDPAALTMAESLDAPEGVASLADAPSEICLRCGSPFPKRTSSPATFCPSCTATALRRAEPRFPGYSQPA